MVQDNQMESVKRESTDKFPCPSCGAVMSFDPASQMLSCDYCDSKIDITRQEGDIKEYDLESAVEPTSQNWGSEKRVIHCDSCGAETVLDLNSTSQFCAFCGSSHVVRNEQSAGISPESLITFKITDKQAMESFKAWIRKRHFAPGALKSEYQAQRLSGIYIPCWTYDADTYSVYTGEGGTYYYVTQTQWVTENGKQKMVTKQVRKIRWWPTSGMYSELYDDVLVNASGKIEEGLMKKLEPFELGGLVLYKPEFLSGFLAERYSIGLKEGWEKAKAIIRGYIHEGVVRQINADEVRNLRINTSFQKVKFKHILLPVWVSAYTYRNKVFRFMVNGQTGKVHGHAPVSPWKVTLLVLGLLVLCAVILAVYGSYRNT